jgi:biotin-(acetyl-CoA carboxylase) ligase
MSAPSGDNRSVVVMGTGINLANHPEGLPQPAVSLAAYGMTVTPADALEALAGKYRRLAETVGRRLLLSPPLGAPGSTAQAKLDGR